MRDIIGTIARSVEEASHRGVGDYLLRYHIQEDEGISTVTITRPDGSEFMLWQAVWQDDATANTKAEGAPNIDVDKWQAVDDLTEWL